MKTSMTQFLLLFLFATSAFIAKSQTKDLIIIDSETKLPVSNASVKLENTNAGTISQNDGKARIQRSVKGSLLISHINYIPTTVQAADIKDQQVIYITPRSAREIEEVILRNPLDNRWIGKWRCISIRTIFINDKGDPIGHSQKYETTNNIKEYKKDRSFNIIQNRKTILIGTYTTDQNQVFENIISAQSRSLEGITNILTYFPHPKKSERMIVQYQLPNSRTITEEEWEKLKDK